MSIVPAATWTGVTDRIRRLQVDRGRQHELDRIEAGTATVVFENRDGYFDPTLNGAVRAMLPIRLFAARGWNVDARTGPGGGVFTGWIERLTFNREGPRDASVTAECVDHLGLLARPFPDLKIQKRKLHRVKSTGGVGYDFTFRPQTVMRRINDALYDAEWANGLVRSFIESTDGAESFANATVVQRAEYGLDSSPLEVIQDAMDALLPVTSTFACTGNGVLEIANRQVSADGGLGISRLEKAAATHPAFGLADEQGLEAAAADPYWASLGSSDPIGDGLVLPVAELEITLDGADVINSCSCYPQNLPGDANLADYLVEDAASIARYGRRSHDLPNLPILKAHDVVFDAVTHSYPPVFGSEMCKRYARFIVANYKEPRPRVRKCVLSRRMTEAIWPFIRTVDISTLVRVYSVNPGGGGIAGTDWFIEGLHHTADAHIAAEPLDWQLELDLSPAGYWTDTGEFTSL